MTLNDAQEAARLVLKEDQGDNDGDHGVDSAENRGDPAEKKERAFHDLQDTDRPGMPASWAILDHCTEYNV